MNSRPGVAAASRGGDAFPANSPFTAPPRGVARVPQQGQYIAALLQRHSIPELPVPGVELGAYNTRDLLQSRSSALGRLSEGGAALALAQSTLEWQLKNRTGVAQGLPAPTPTPTPTPTTLESARTILSQEVATNSSRAVLFEAHRRSVVARSEEAIVGRRRPHTVYHERPSLYSDTLNPTLASLAARQAASGAPGGVGELLPGVTPKEDENPYLYLQYPEVAMDKDGVVTSPFRFPRSKRISVPIILGTAGATARAATAAAGATRNPVQKQQGRVRRPTQLASWEAQKGALGVGVSSSSSGNGNGAGADSGSSGGGTGTGISTASEGGGVGVACGAYSVISNAGKLLERFVTESVQEAEATVQAAGKLGVRVGVEGGGGEGEFGGETIASIPLEIPPPLPQKSIIARALRPATAPDTSSRRPLPPAHPPHSGGAVAAAPPPKGAAAASGGGVPSAPSAPVPSLYTGGLLYGMNPLDRERQIVSLKDAILQSYAKKLKAGKAPPAGKK